MQVSILNDVLGPVMRGPSSSHTAGSYHIARTASRFLGEKPVFALFRFDPEGSYARTYRQQDADTAFGAGLLGRPMEAPRFSKALEDASSAGVNIVFEVRTLPRAGHPNTVDIMLESKKGQKMSLSAASTGGGGFKISRFQDVEVDLHGYAHVLLAEFLPKDSSAVEELLKSMSVNPVMSSPEGQQTVFCRAESPSPFSAERLSRLKKMKGVKNIWTAPPVFFPQKGREHVRGPSRLVSYASSGKMSLGEAALEREARLLGVSGRDISAEMERRYEVMVSSVEKGLEGSDVRLRFLSPFAGEFLRRCGKGLLPYGGLPSRAAARALAALHYSCSGGLVCAAPTGASAGVLPGVLTTLEKEKNIGRKHILRALFSAGAVGAVVAERATFAAETAGCQVEIGAAGAMAAAAVAEAFNGSARQAADAAAVFFQNIMGSVCDLVQGFCEIPCHTRNAAAASSAFLCADLVLGGYANPVPLEETVDAVYAVGQTLPPELRCTSRGGLALCPSAKRLSPSFRKR